jgi:hypothetical protein
MLGARRLIHSGDNRRSVGPNSAGEPNRRQMLVCSWHWGPGDGRLECSWHIEPADDSLGDRAGRWSPIANAHRAHDSHAKDSIDTEHCGGARAAHDRNSPGNRNGYSLHVAGRQRRLAAVADQLLPVVHRDNR